jgi:hypothetical protein
VILKQAAEPGADSTGAKITNLPEPVYKPDLAAAFKIIDSVNGPEQLYGLAKMSLNGIDAHRRRRDMSPKAAQGIANGLMIAALALLTISGVPRSDLEPL